MDIILLIIMWVLAGTVLLFFAGYYLWVLTREIERLPCLVRAKRPPDRFFGPHRVTFENARGYRLELAVPQRDFEGLAEGDRGALKIRGLLYWGFEHDADDDRRPAGGSED